MELTADNELVDVEGHFAVTSLNNDVSLLTVDNGSIVTLFQYQKRWNFRRPADIFI